jgi:hypothetical protein
MSDDLVKRLRGWPASVAGDTMGEAADRIEELEARAEAAEAELLETQDRANAFATKEYHTEMRAKQAEAKLAKAVDLLGQWRIAAAGYVSVESVVNKHDDTLAELTGGKNDGTV